MLQIYLQLKPLDMFVDLIRPSQQFFSYVRTGLPGLIEPVLSWDKCVLLKDTTQCHR